MKFSNVNRKEGRGEEKYKIINSKEGDVQRFYT